jgi:hypothetical protein
MAKTLLKLKQLESLTAARALESAANGAISASVTTATELAFLASAASNSVTADKAAIYASSGVLSATTLDATSLEVTNLKAKDGSAAGSIANSTGVVTLASSVLTTADINGGSIDGATLGAAAQVTITDADMNGGSVDGVIIGAASAAAGTFAALTATSFVMDSATISLVTLKAESFADSDSALPTTGAVKQYVDGIQAGLDVKASCAVASIASFTMAADPSPSTSTLVLADGEFGFDASNDRIIIDGVTLTHASNVGARILVKDGVNQGGTGIHQKWNGVYTLGALDGSTCTLTRATDFDAGTEFIGAPFFFIDAGTVNAFHGFVASVSAAPTIGTHVIPFFQFTAPSESQAGNGIGKTGNAFDLALAELTEKAADAVAGDMIAISDSENSGVSKKISVTNLVDLMDGDGLAATSGVLAVDIATNPGLEFNSAKLRIKMDGSSLNRGAGGLKVNNTGIGHSQMSMLEAEINIAAAAGEETGNITLPNADQADVTAMQGSPLTQVYYNGLRLSKASSEVNAKGSNAAHGDYFLKRHDDNNIKVCFDAADYVDNDKLQVIICKTVV